MIEITIRSFAMIREILGAKSISFSIHNENEIVTSVLDQLCNKYPSLKSYLYKDRNFNPEYVIAVNKERLNYDELETIILKPGDELAIIPPAGGG